MNSVIQTNASPTNARVRDLDFATDTANLSKNRVLQQAGWPIPAQARANAGPQRRALATARSRTEKAGECRLFLSRTVFLSR